jgi:hypothetical protein
LWEGVLSELRKRHPTVRGGTKFTVPNAAFQVALFFACCSLVAGGRRPLPIVLQIVRDHATFRGALLDEPLAGAAADAIGGAATDGDAGVRERKKRRTETARAELKDSRCVHASWGPGTILQVKARSVVVRFRGEGADEEGGVTRSVRLGQVRLI